MWKKFLYLFLLIPHFVLAQFTIIPQNGKITWEMEKRFGDLNNTTIVEIPNVPNYVNPTGGRYLNVKVKFKLDHPVISKQMLGVTDDPNRYLRVEWYINGEFRNQQLRPNARNLFEVTLKEEHEYEIDAIYVYESPTAKIVFDPDPIQIRPDDILIVTLGDSYSSGEGNPSRIHDQGLVWAEAIHTWGSENDVTGGGAGITYDHQLAHRSATAWSSLTALQLENEDPHTSVTYVNLASGGAVVRNLIDTRQEKKNDSRFRGTHSYTQIDEAKRLVGGRTIDALTLSVGGNDVGFMNVILAYLLKLDNPINSTDDRQLEAIKEAFDTGKWRTGEGFLEDWVRKRLNAVLKSLTNNDFSDVVGLDHLRKEFGDLNLKLVTELPNTKRIFLLEYPDISSGCSKMLKTKQNLFNLAGQEVSLNLAIDGQEITHARDEIFKPLNDLLREFAQGYGWTFLSPEPAGYSWNNHGECMSNGQPGYPGYQYYYENRNPGIAAKNVRWVTSFHDSEQYQDNVLGTAHPNAFGHYAISLSFLARFKETRTNWDILCNPTDYPPTIPTFSIGSGSSERPNPIYNPSHPFHKRILARFITVSNSIGTPISCNQQLKKDWRYIWEAGQEIILEPGFDSNKGTDFEALINKKLK